MADTEKDTRLYIKLHNRMPEHPKIEGLSDAAFRLLVTLWCWCDDNHTDGLVREASWRKRGTPKARRELLDARLAEATDNGVQMHDFLGHQRSAAEKLQLREKRSKSGAAGGRAKASAVANAKQVVEQMISKPVAEIALALEGSSVGRGGGGSSVPRENPPPDSPFCPNHPAGTSSACADCANARRAYQAQATAAVEQARVRRDAAENRRKRCKTCNGDGWRDDNPEVRCDHQPERTTA